jgi:hypothetical protein
MNFGIDTLATPATLILCMSIYAIVFCARRVLEGALRKYKFADNWFWRELALPVMPSVVGAVLGAFAKFFPFPEGFTHWGSRALFGLVCGFVSALVYKIALSIVRKLWPGVLPSTPGGELPSP